MVLLKFLQLLSSSGFGFQIFSDDCPSRGPRAIAEFASLSGCSETNIDARFCETTNFTGQEVCLGDELMTTLERNRTNLLSRITVANFEDLGYEVDYTNVDVYTSENIDSSCRCAQRRELSTEHDMLHQSFAYEQRKPRQLGEELYRRAVSYGKMKLAEAKEQYDMAMADDGYSANESTEGQKFVGDQAITVTFMENGEIYSIVVRA